MSYKIVASEGASLFSAGIKGLQMRKRRPARDREAGICKAVTDWKLFGSVDIHGLGIPNFDEKFKNRGSATEMQVSRLARDEFQFGYEGCQQSQAVSYRS